MHETVIAANEIKNAGFLFRAPVAFEGELSDPCGKAFQKGQLHDFGATVGQVNGALDPEFLLLVDAEPAFALVVANEVGAVIQQNYIVIVNAIEIRGVGNDGNSLRYTLFAGAGGDAVAQIIVAVFGR